MFILSYEELRSFNNVFRAFLATNPIFFLIRNNMINSLNSPKIKTRFNILLLIVIRRKEITSFRNIASMRKNNQNCILPSCCLVASFIVLNNECSHSIMQMPVLNCQVSNYCKTLVTMQIKVTF